MWGVEISEESVACAIENAELNGITNAAFFAGNVSLALEELHERAGPPDVVVVDPPRAGLAGKALRRMARLEAPRIVYVSCNPTTLASDLKALREDFGYELRRCRPVDMFPHTPHIETRQPARARGAATPRLPRHRRELARSVAHLEAALAPGLPEQVGVREQEPERDRGQRGEAVDVRGRRQRSASAASSPTIEIQVQRDPEPEAVGGGEEEREEEDVGRPDVRRALLARAAGTRSRCGRTGSAARTRRSRSARARPRARRPRG